jgi:hypothetical protein
MPNTYRKYMRASPIEIRPMPRGDAIDRANIAIFRAFLANPGLVHDYPIRRPSKSRNVCDLSRYMIVMTRARRLRQVMSRARV